MNPAARPAPSPADDTLLAFEESLALARVIAARLSAAVRAAGGAGDDDYRVRLGCAHALALVDLLEDAVEREA